MRLHGYLILLLLIAPDTAARAVSGDEAPRPEAIVLSSDTVEVPMNLDTGRPVVEVTVNGRGPYRFILDTGAGSTLIDADLAAELKLPVVGETPVGDPSNPEAFAADLVKAEVVELGGARLEGVTMLAFGVRRMMGKTYGGVLGLPDLAGLLVSLDYPQGRVILTPGELPAADPRVVEYKPHGCLISLPMSVAGEPVTVHLDSGNPGGFMLPLCRADDWKLKSEPVEIGRAGTLTKVVTIYSGQIDGEIEVGGLTFIDPEVDLSDRLAEWANMGSDALQDIVLTVDQKNHRLRMDRTATVVERRPARRRIGVMFMGMTGIAGGLPITDGGLKIERVIPGSLAEKAGLEAEDVILSINDRPAKDLDQDNVSRMFGGQDPLHMEIRRNGKILKFIVQ